MNTGWLPLGVDVACLVGDVVYVPPSFLSAHPEIRDGEFIKVGANTNVQGTSAFTCAMICAIPMLSPHFHSTKAQTTTAIMNSLGGCREQILISPQSWSKSSFSHVEHVHLRISKPNLSIGLLTSLDRLLYLSLCGRCVCVNARLWLASLDCTAIVDHISSSMNCELDMFVISSCNITWVGQNID